MKYEDYKCPNDKCLLCLIYPNSDAGLACDSSCHFSKGEDGEGTLASVINMHPKEWADLKN